MPQRPKRHRPPGSRSPQQRKADADRRRPSARERGYTSKWERERKRYLDEHPLCVHCEAEGRVEAATVVDHIVPHRGDLKLFWRRSNWQALCTTHHNRKTATEDGGFGRPPPGGAKV